MGSRKSFPVVVASFTFLNVTGPVRVSTSFFFIPVGQVSNDVLSPQSDVNETRGDAGSNPKIVGAAVGVGLVVGESVGLIVGEFVGLVVGESVGLVVGEPVGLVVGESVGLVVGESVGLAVGESVGLEVGESVGLAVGESVGLVVGDSVVPHLGATLGPPPCASVPQFSPGNSSPREQICPGPIFPLFLFL